MAAKRITVGVRVSAEMVREIDAYSEQLRASVPAGVEVNRSDAARAMLEVAARVLRGGHR